MSSKIAQQGTVGASAMRRETRESGRVWDPEEECLYPSSDGQPMADNTWQANAMVQAFYTLNMHFSDRPDALVCVDLLVYYEEGTQLRVAPDVFVSFGVGAGNRMTYKVWEEGKPPDFVLEVLSPKMSKRDQDEKQAVYAGMGVREFWLFDPMGGLMQPRLRGSRLVGGRYGELPRLLYPDGRLAVYSEVLKLEFQVVDESLRIWNPRTEAYLETVEEIEQSRQQERKARLQEERKARLQEERRARLRAEQRQREAEHRQQEERKARLETERRLEELLRSAGKLEDTAHRG